MALYEATDLKKYELKNVTVITKSGDSFKGNIEQDEDDSNVYWLVTPDNVGDGHKINVKDVKSAYGSGTKATIELKTNF